MNRWIVVAVCLLISLALASCAGMNLGDLVRVKTPVEVQQDKGLPGSLSLNESEQQYRAWVDDVRRVGAHWRTSIEGADRVRDLLGQITLRALDDVGPSVAGVPVLGPSLPLLAGLAGLFIRRPGDADKDTLRKEKEASYNAGIEAGKSLPVLSG